MEKIIIAGGSGFLGHALTLHFKNRFEFVVLTRRPSYKKNGVTYVQWDAKNPRPEWTSHLEGATAVINLCGKSVDCRYTKKNKAEIFASRLDSTNVIGEAIKNAKQPPQIWINAASATIYRHSEDLPMTESQGVTGEGFSVEVCKAWEATFNRFNLPSTRKINLRITLVLGREGGVYPVLRKLSMFGLGGTMGPGTQRISWVHISDFCRVVEWVIDHPQSSGVYNVSAPEALTNKDFMHSLRKSVGMPVEIPSPTPLLEVGAFFLRTETELLLKSRYVAPERLTKEGFQFTFKNTESALKDLK